MAHANKLQLISVAAAIGPAGDWTVPGNLFCSRCPSACVNSVVNHGVLHAQLVQQLIHTCYLALPK